MIHDVSNHLKVMSAILRRFGHSHNAAYVQVGEKSQILISGYFYSEVKYVDHKTLYKIYLQM